MKTPKLDSLHASVDLTGKILTVQIDHGRANEMGSQQIADWEKIVEWLENSVIQCLVTYSQRQTKRGTPVFIAGADVTERHDWSEDTVRVHVRRQRSVLQRLRNVPVFHVCLVNGVALGWGTEFLIACDYRIAMSTASFALPETSIGILPGAGGTGELWTMIGIPQAMRLGITGERIDAAEAHRIGLVQELTADLQSGLERVYQLAGQVMKRSPTAIF